MTYDPEKYREKREKVLGIKKRGIGFGALALAVSFVIIAGLGAVTVPQAVSYITTRHLEDAIFKLESASGWPNAVIERVIAVDGVIHAIQDKNKTRLVVTYDRRKATLSSITTLFVEQDLLVTLLNEVNHRQHQTTLKDEEEDLETP
jgi:hypothetical protein